MRSSGHSMQRCSCLPHYPFVLKALVVLLATTPASGLKQTIRLYRYYACRPYCTAPKLCVSLNARSPELVRKIAKPGSPQPRENERPANYVLPNCRKSASLDSNPQRRLDNVLYYGSIQLGMPGQALTVCPDTGSAAVWTAADTTPPAANGNSDFSASYNGFVGNASSSFQVQMNTVHLVLSWFYKEAALLVPILASTGTLRRLCMESKVCIIFWITAVATQCMRHMRQWI